MAAAAAPAAPPPPPPGNTSSGNNFSDIFKRQVNYLRVNGISGVLLSDSAEISRGSEPRAARSNTPDSGEVSGSARREGCGEDLVQIRVPYAGTSLTITLLFYLNEPWMSPEMDFDDDHFSASITARDLRDLVPALTEWDFLAHDIIAQLVYQVLQLYRRHQLDRLEEEDTLHIQYQALLKALKIGEGDIEIAVSHATTTTTTATTTTATTARSSFLMRLPLSLQDVPPVLVDANPASPTTLLQVEFPKREGAFVPRLYLSPCVESLIGETSSLALPAVPPGLGLLDYVERVMQLLEEKVRRTVLCFETRKQFIAEVLCQFGAAVVEYDAERFSKIVLMLEVKDFHFLTFITLGKLFPQQERPKVVLQSLYHNTAREPVSMEVKECKYSAQWKPEEMVQETREAILANVSAFQMNSVRNS